MVGQTLVATPGAWGGNPTKFTYQWEDCDASGNNCTLIAGATASSYTVQQSDVGDTLRTVVVAWNNQGSAAQTSAATSVVTGFGPLQVSANGRYLVTSTGAPWLMLGDSPQSLIGDNSQTTADSYLDDREAHGFNAVWLNLLCSDYTFCNTDGKSYNDSNSTADNLAPFTSGTAPASYLFGSGQCGNCNAAYFSRAHAIIAHAQSDGIEVVLDPIETGGWLTMLDNASNGDGTVSTTDGDYRYGQYLGTTFGDLKNIIWMSGNDFNQSSLPSTADSNDALSVANGIANTDPSALQTVEFNYFNSKSTDVAAWSSRISLDGVYTYAPTYTEALSAYNSSSSLPTFLEESNYEAEHNSGGPDGCAGGGGEGSIPTASQALNCRLTEWWMATSGATGQLYGSYFSDSLGCGCSHNGGTGAGPTVAANGYTASNIDTVAVTQLGYLTSLFGAVAWQNLSPDQSGTLVTSPAGVSNTTNCPTSGSIFTTGTTPRNCVTTAWDATNKTLAVIYDPQGVAVTVALSQMAAGKTTTAKWYDPTTGSYTTIGSFSDSGSQTWTPSGNNNAGSPDWVLLLQAT